MFRNFKVRSIAIRQPPESPFSKGDLRNSPLIKGVRGLFVMDNLLHIKKSRCQRQPNLYARHCPPVLFCWFNRPRLNQNVSVQATSPEPAQKNLQNDIKIAIGGYHATLMYEGIASTDDGTPSGFTRRRGKSREVTAHLKGE